MSEELKPCPFCGCEVKIVIDVDGIFGKSYTIVHPESTCIIASFDCYSTEDRNKLIEHWNKRV